MYILDTTSTYQLMSIYVTCFKYAIPINSFSPHNNPIRLSITIVPIL